VVISRGFPALASFAVAVSAACVVQPQDSCEHDTQNISVVAVATDNGTDIRAELDFDGSDRSGFPYPLELCDDDDLTIAGETPERTNRVDRVVYSVNLPIEAAARELEFRLERKSMDESVSFTIPLPPAFAVVAPQVDEGVSRGADYLLEWAPPNAGEQMRVGLTEEIGFGVCLETAIAEHDYKTMDGVAVDDNGSWTIPADVIGSADGGECEAVYAFMRLAPAPYPTDFLAGGYLEGRVERTVAFRSTP
jgi:hypothetical protein